MVLNLLRSGNGNHTNYIKKWIRFLNIGSHLGNPPQRMLNFLEGLMDEMGMSFNTNPNVGMQSDFWWAYFENSIYCLLVADTVGMTDPAYRSKTRMGFQGKGKTLIIQAFVFQPKFSKGIRVVPNLCTASPVLHEMVFWKAEKNIEKFMTMKLSDFTPVHVHIGSSSVGGFWILMLFILWTAFIDFEKSRLVFIQEANRSFNWRPTKECKKMYHNS